jgi:hypothetical protein
VEIQNLLERKVVVAKAEPLFDTIGARGTKSKRDATLMLQVAPQAAVDGLNHGRREMDYAP